VVTTLDDFFFFLDDQRSGVGKQKQIRETINNVDNTIDYSYHGKSNIGVNGDDDDDESFLLLRPPPLASSDKQQQEEDERMKQEEEARQRRRQHDYYTGTGARPTRTGMSSQPQTNRNHSKLKLLLLQYVNRMMQLDLQNATCSKWIIYTPPPDGINDDANDLLSPPYQELVAATSSLYGGAGWCTLVILTEEDTMMMMTMERKTRKYPLILSKICHDMKYVYCKSYSPPSDALAHNLFDRDYDYCHYYFGHEHDTSSLDGDGGNRIAIQCKLLRTLYLSYHPDSVNVPELTRRNFGYLLAMSLGAESIVDLGGRYQIMMKSEMSLLNNSHHLEVSVVMQGSLYFNPFPLLQNPQNHYDSPTIGDAAINETSLHQGIQWPRGFPGLCMEPLSHQYSKGKIAFCKNVTLASSNSTSSVLVPSKSYRIGVVQLVPDVFQDVDDPQNKAELYIPHRTNPLMVPSHSFAPYDMHSTLHTYDALWSVILPTTNLPQRYADIARSYFAQCLFPDMGLRVVYMPSVVTQHVPQQPKHSTSTGHHSSFVNATTKDSKHVSDIDVHKQIKSIISYLSTWDSPFDTLPARMEHLWKDLYSRHYISKQDVELVQSWLLYLKNIGYKFPKLTKRRFRNVAVMGHFNYAQSPSQIDDVVFWTQKYREWFETVVVTGPFQPGHIQELKRHSIQAFRGERNEEGGYFQVTENLKNVLLHFKNRRNIESVMYFHDDGMVNITELSRGQFPFPTHDIIGNYRDQRYDLSYSDIRKIQDVELANKFSYRIYPNGTVCAFNKVLCQPSVKELYRELPLYPWGMTTKGYCGVSQQELASDEEIFPYHEDDGSLLFSSFTQSDFLHIPTRYAEEFEKLASLFLKHNVIHECAWGTIVDMIRKKYNATVRLTMLCTSWGPKRRGKKALIERCLRDNVDYGVFHPFKIGFKENGFKGYDWAFDSVQY
jgi:hypothetical protein